MPASCVRPPSGACRRANTGRLGYAIDPHGVIEFGTPPAIYPGTLQFAQQYAPNTLLADWRCAATRRGPIQGGIYPRAGEARPY